MATIKYLLQTKKESAPIYLRFSLGRNQTIKRKTGLIIDPKKWSATTGFPIAKSEHLKALKTELQKLKTYIEENFNNDNSKGKSINSEWLEQKINTFFDRIDNSNDINTISGIIQYVIDNASTRKNGKGGIGISIGRIKGYNNLKNLLEKYLDGKTLLVRDVNLKFSNELKNWLLNTQNYSESFMQKKISDLKFVCNEANNLGVEVNKQLHLIKKTTTNNNTDVVYLSETELKKIYNTEFKNEKLNNAKNWLLLGCEIGQRVGDLLNLTEGNISTYKNLSSRKIISLTQQKTNKKVIIPLSKDALNIINDSFPYKISSQHFNEYIKDVCKDAKINKITKGGKMCPETKRKVFGKFKKWELITSHTCRRSFASNYYGKMDTALIKSVTGHTTEASLLTYIGKTSADYTEQIFQAMDNNNIL